MLKAEKEMKEIFTGKTKEKDFLTLKEKLFYFGAAIPTLYKQYTALCEENGVQFMGYNIDESFNNCIDSFILIDIQKIKESKKRRYIG